MINVTKPVLPELEEYQEYLRQIWKSNTLTNGGPLAEELELKIGALIDERNFCLVSNGTIALQLLIHEMQLSGEIITTPFTYVATINSILWEKCKPVFVDIDKKTLCIDPKLVEEKITDKTSAIIGVHVYGIPCDVFSLDEIAKKNNIKIIYDAAHAFHTKIDNKHISDFGDASIFSFHATKLFHTVEGGGVVCKDNDLHSKINLARVFGHNNDDYFQCGINAKMSEFHAAMGLCNLVRLDDVINKRKIITERYDALIGDVVWRPKSDFNVEENYSYYPVIFADVSERERVFSILERNAVNARKYFSPSLNKLSFLTEDTECPVSEDICERVLCLPIYPQLELAEVENIGNLIISVLR